MCLFHWATGEAEGAAHPEGRHNCDRLASVGPTQPQMPQTAGHSGLYKDSKRKKFLKVQTVKNVVNAKDLAELYIYIPLQATNKMMEEMSGTIRV